MGLIVAFHTRQIPKLLYQRKKTQNKYHKTRFAVERFFFAWLKNIWFSQDKNQMGFRISCMMIHENSFLMDQDKLELVTIDSKSDGAYKTT